MAAYVKGGIRKRVLGGCRRGSGPPPGQRGGGCHLGPFYILKGPAKFSFDKRPLLIKAEKLQFRSGHKRPMKGSGGCSATGQKS